MTALLAVCAFAALFALAAVVPLKGEGGGCGGACHGCDGSGCDLVTERPAGPGEPGRAGGFDLERDR